jgi:hypothetical protein
VPRRARDFVHCPLRRRARRPQRKGDPSDSSALTTCSASSLRLSRFWCPHCSGPRTRPTRLARAPRPPLKCAAASHAVCKPLSVICSVTLRRHAGARPTVLWLTVSRSHGSGTEISHARLPEARIAAVPTNRWRFSAASSTSPVGGSTTCMSTICGRATQHSLNPSRSERGARCCLTSP